MDSEWNGRSLIGMFLLVLGPAPVFTRPIDGTEMAFDAVCFAVMALGGFLLWSGRQALKRSRR
jgi:hypothetical protein